MTPTTNDPLRQTLGESLADLDGGGASPGFTDRLLHELTLRTARRRQRRKRILSALGIVLVAAVAAVTSLERGGEPSVDVSSEAEELRQEYARLQDDLEALRESARETAPVLYLGGDDELDLVLDLAPIVTRTGALTAPAATARIDPYEL